MFKSMNAPRSNSETEKNSNSENSNLMNKKSQIRNATTDKYYKVPNYQVNQLKGRVGNSQQTPSFARSTAAPGSSSGTTPGAPRTTSPTAPPPQAPRTMTPGSTTPTTPGAPRTSTPHTTPVPGTSDPRTMPDSTTPMTPGSSTPDTTTPTTPRTMPGTAAPTTPGTMPGTTTPMTPGTSTPGTTTPTTPRTMPGSTTPMTPGTSTPGTTTPTSPRTLPGSTVPMTPGTTTPTTPRTMPGTAAPTTPGTMPGTTTPRTNGARRMPNNQTPPYIYNPLKHNGSMGTPNGMQNMPQNNGMPGMPRRNGSIMDGVPMNGMPMNGMPMNGAPMNGTPMNGAPMNGAPMNGAPMNGAPMNMYMPNNAPYGTPMGIPLMPLYGYDNSADLDRDMEYIRQLYPNTAKMILREINDECDKLEYDGSCMFDEYPDKVTLDRLVDIIYERVRDRFDEDELQTQSIYGYPDRRRPNYLRDIVSIILLNEFFNRRRRYRSRRRWY